MSNANTNTATTNRPTRRVRAGHAPLASLHRVNSDQMHGNHTHLVAGHIEQRPTVPPQWHNPAQNNPAQNSQAHSALDHGTHPIDTWTEAHLLAAAIGLVAGAVGLVALIMWAVR